MLHDVIQAFVLWQDNRQKPMNTEILTFFFINNTSLLCCKSTPNDIYYWRKICIIIVHIFRYNLHFGENELIFAEAI